MIVKLKPAPDQEPKIPSMPGGQLPSGIRPPNLSDIKLQAEALVPANLCLADVVVPVFDKLNAILTIRSRYNWSSPEDVINANYDQVSADLTMLTFVVIDCVDVETQIALAYDNAVSNRDVIWAYHYDRLRAEANEAYTLQNVDYRNKIGARPDRVTDSEIKARVDVLLATLGYPKLINSLKSAKDQVAKIIGRAENALNTFKKLIDRAQKHGG